MPIKPHAQIKITALILKHSYILLESIFLRKYISS